MKWKIRKPRVNIKKEWEKKIEISEATIVLFKWQDDIKIDICMNEEVVKTILI